MVCATHTHCAPALEQRAGLHLRQAAPRRPGRADRPLHPRADRRDREGRAGGPGGPQARRPWPGARARSGSRPTGACSRRGSWVGFGVNPNGPIDPSLPVLAAVDASGKVRAVLFGYACHCTTLGGEFNKICAEWAGYACDEIERQSPGAVALAIIGCGADANPEPRRNLDDAKQHGAAAAAEVNRLLAASPASPPCPAGSPARFRRLELPLEPLPDRATLAERDQQARRRGVPGPHAARAARPRRVDPHVRALRRPDLVLRRRHGHGLPRRRGRRRLRPAAQVGDRRRAALGRRLQQRRALLHPVATDPQRRRLRGR